MSRTIQQQREYRKKHLERIRKYAREWARRNPIPYFWNEAKRETQRRYRAKHKEEIAEKRRIAFRKKIKENPTFRVAWLLRSRIVGGIKQKNGKKTNSATVLLGCSIKFARKHIEKQWNENMNWENHGKLWEIDHIIPISRFNLLDEEEQKKAFHYTNLQPLIKFRNRSKGNKIMI